MPWTIDENGDKKYVVSMYVKEDLPTWFELYNEFYKKRIHNYERTENTEMDKYWKIPRRMYILITTCNKLNKIIQEDEPLYNQMKELICPGKGNIDIKLIFRLISSNPDIMENALDFNKGIYTLKHPERKENPFILNPEDRLYIPDDVDNLQLSIVAARNPTDIEFINVKDVVLDNITNLLLKDVIEYFEGDRPGWKDKDDNVISSNKPNHCNGNGFDPAL